MANSTIVIKIIGYMVGVDNSIEICLMAAEAVSWRVLIPVGVTGNALK